MAVTFVSQGDSRLLRPIVSDLCVLSYLEKYLFEVAQSSELGKERIEAVLTFSTGLAVTGFPFWPQSDRSRHCHVIELSTLYDR